MKEQYRELFVFNRSQRRGIFVLLTIILLVTSARIVLNWSADDVFSSYTVTAPDFKEPRAQNVPTYVIKDNTIEIKRKPLHAFDPNEVSKTTLMEFGFTHRQAATFIKYRLIIGGYKTNQEVAKVYGMTPELLDRIIPYMGLIDDQDPQKTKQPERRDVQVINVNTADSALLTELPGIGPVFARRIVRYRERIGGFVSIDQLKDVYGMKEETLLGIRSVIEVTGDPIKRNINALSVKQLRSLPYIEDWNQARAIFNYREQHGDYKSQLDLLKIKLLDSAQVNRMLPYIRFNDRGSN